jgi:hypothetical protein
MMAVLTAVRMVGKFSNNVVVIWLWLVQWLPLKVNILFLAPPRGNVKIRDVTLNQATLQQPPLLQRDRLNQKTGVSLSRLAGKLCAATQNWTDDTSSGQIEVGEGELNARLFFAFQRLCTTIHMQHDRKRKRGKSGS